jgi:protein tyrosine phosphatase (PTP) superfamily phosphohydrolase (DUF442 family)
MLETIKNYRKITNKLHTSAQPTIDEFKLIKQAGIEMVINLARADSPEAIANEAQVIQENELHYINIPVDFKKPDRSDLDLFFKAMDQHSDKATLVHCAYNWRVSCFVYLYRVIKQGCDNETAIRDMLAVWTPDETWQSFIDLCLSNPEKIKK